MACEENFVLTSGNVEHYVKDFPDEVYISTSDRLRVEAEARPELSCAEVTSELIAFSTTYNYIAPGGVFDLANMEFIYDGDSSPGETIDVFISLSGFGVSANPISYVITMGSGGAISSIVPTVTGPTEYVMGQSQVENDWTDVYMFFDYSNPARAGSIRGIRMQTTQYVDSINMAGFVSCTLERCAAAPISAVNFQPPRLRLANFEFYLNPALYRRKTR
jgi:hypothetical protein